MSLTARSSPSGTRIHPSATVHPTATVEGDVEIGPDTVVGPGCIVLGTVGPVRIGTGCSLVARAVVNGPISLGDGNVLYRNTCILASGAALAGHVEVQDRVIIGGCTAIHQFVRLGRGCFVSGALGLGLDLPPWFTATANNLVASVNLVGLRRSGAGREAIEAVRWAFKTIYRSGFTPQQAIPLLEERIAEPAIAECVAFMRATKRGICHGVGRAARGTAAGAADE